jgi:hypothetical protein
MEVIDFFHRLELGRVRRRIFSAALAGHRSKQVNCGHKQGLMSTELRDFRTASDDELEK